MIKAIIFDWGRTIYDKENERLFPETQSVLKYCFKKYNLSIVSLATDDDIEGRFAKIDKYDIRKYFKFILFHVNDKESLLRNTIGNLNIKPEEIMVIDDRIKRLSFPIKIGCQTIWIKKGKFFNEEPDSESGKPDYIVKSLEEVLKIL
ncbi:MAG: HAD hydrolase-like protein [Patescibacteria group bacterium]|jgi:FMN phosphatase YigB (HAD superfamily)